MLCILTSCSRRRLRASQKRQWTLQTGAHYARHAFNGVDLSWATIKHATELAVDLGHAQLPVLSHIVKVLIVVLISHYIVVL